MTCKVWIFFFKAGVGNILLESPGKKSIITFQDFVIEAVWEETRVLCLLLAPFSGFKSLPSDSGVLPFKERIQGEGIPIGYSTNEDMHVHPYQNVAKVDPMAEILQQKLLFQHF